MSRALATSDDPSTPRGRVLMVQGTSSHAGKSTLVAAFCRLFARAGYRVAPFKAQNMSNNAAVTATGEEIGRAQAMQAAAAGVAPTADMNPVLLKPQSDQTSQIVVLGHAQQVANAQEYYALRSTLWPIVTASLDRLRASHDLVVIEGAGSPAEINLAQYDIVNMRVARYADAPVLLVGDIERGGVFAALYGTVALLAPAERALIRGFIINKFRGDASLLTPGFEMLQERTGIRTIGVIPWLDLGRVPAEDALDWNATGHPSPSATTLDIAIIRLPRIANLDEFQPLICEPNVRVRFIGDAAELANADLIVVPGTKSTLADLAWLYDRGLAVGIQDAARAGTPVLGICGGFQMIGRRIIDDDGAESRGDTVGLGLLPVITCFAPDKVTRQVTARVASATALWSPDDRTNTRPDGDSLGVTPLSAYEIHMGRTDVPSAAPQPARAFVVTSSDTVTTDGLVGADGAVVGTYLHGLLENAPLRHALLQRLAARKGIQLPVGSGETLDGTLDALAQVVRVDLDWAAVTAMVGLEPLV